MDRKETFRIAIQAEIMSQNLYKSLAKSFTKPEASTVFQQLIPYEEMHEAKLRELFSQEYPGEKLVLDMEQMPDFKQFKVVEPKQILDFAIEREELAHDIYTQMAADSKDEATKKLLLGFAAEEENHKTILFTEVQRLQGMIKWFDPSELNGFMED
jgi:rubrerythrin